MSMSMELVVFFIGQSVVILGALVVSYVRIQVAIAKLQADVKHIYCVHATRAEEHKDLTDKVDGISRTVARMEGTLKAS